MYTADDLNPNYRHVTYSLADPRHGLNKWFIHRRREYLCRKRTRKLDVYDVAEIEVMRNMLEMAVFWVVAPCY
jgi:hypothetical protein